MDKKFLTNKIKRWLLPEGVYVLLSAMAGCFLKYITLSIIEEKTTLARNRRFKDLHKGKRCFILGCSPSVKQQDLKLLKGETCISVSNFFVHPDFNLIKPRYHCVGSLHPPFTEGNYINWFKAMEPYMKDTIVFLAYSDRQIVSKHKLFDKSRVNYLDFNDTLSRVFNKRFELTQCLPSVQSVSIMALMLAIYLGFKEIYLLGIEHTVFRLDGNFEYRHFYEGKNANVAGEMPEPEDLEVEFRALANLWQQYKVFRSRAHAEGIKIFNAAEGGLLDLFPRVKYETLFK